MQPLPYIAILIISSYIFWGVEITVVNTNPTINAQGFLMTGRLKYDLHSFSNANFLRVSKFLTGKDNGNAFREILSCL
jgi:hypothetical protein